MISWWFPGEFVSCDSPGYSWWDQGQLSSSKPDFLLVSIPSSSENACNTFHSVEPPPPSPPAPRQPRRSVNRRFFTVVRILHASLGAKCFSSALLFKLPDRKDAKLHLASFTPPPPSFRLRLVMEPFHLSTLIVHSPPLRHLPPPSEHARRKEDNSLFKLFNGRVHGEEGRSTSGYRKWNTLQRCFFDLGRPFCYRRKRRRPRPQYGCFNEARAVETRSQSTAIFIFNDSRRDLRLHAPLSPLLSELQLERVIGRLNSIPKTAQEKLMAKHWVGDILV